MKKASVIAIFVIIGLVGLTIFSSAEGKKEAKPEQVKIAAVFPGSIQDADYNYLGYIALQEVGKEYKINVAYSERVAVPDAKRVMEEYISDGYNLIWVHGAQFNSAAIEIGPNYPKVSFVFEVDEKPADMFPNFWYLDRQYYVGQYVLGALAGLVTKTGKIGFIGGMGLPFLRGEIYAAKQGIKDAGSDATLEHIYIGDFNDPIKTKNAAQGLIARGVDVLLSHLNLGAHGMYTAVKEADKPVYFAVELADKYDQAPENYLSADLHNFVVPFKALVGRALKGEKGGYILMEYGEGKSRYAQLPIRNVSEEINQRVRRIAEDVAAGKIKVIKDFSELK